MSLFLVCGLITPNLSLSGECILLILPLLYFFLVRFQPICHYLGRCKCIFPIPWICCGLFFDSPKRLFGICVAQCCCFSLLISHFWRSLSIFVLNKKSLWWQDLEYAGKSRQSTNWGCVRRPVGSGSPCKYVNAPSIRNQQAVQL